MSARERLANLTVRGPGKQKPELYRRLLDDTQKEKEQAERALAEKSAEFRKKKARERIGLTEVAGALHLVSLASLPEGENRYLAEEGPLLRKRPVKPPPCLPAATNAYTLEVRCATA